MDLGSLEFAKRHPYKDPTCPVCGNSTAVETLSIEHLSTKIDARDSLKARVAGG